jgi:hypothetical protein
MVPVLNAKIVKLQAPSTRHLMSETPVSKKKSDAMTDKEFILKVAVVAQHAQIT